MSDAIRLAVVPMTITVALIAIIAVFGLGLSLGAVPAKMIVAD